jgi:hypothetical protein
VAEIKTHRVRFITEGEHTRDEHTRIELDGMDISGCVQRFEFVSDVNDPLFPKVQRVRLTLVAAVEVPNVLSAIIEPGGTDG